MSVSYNNFTEAFLDKISSYDFLKIEENDRTKMIDRFMKRALTSFRKNCDYDLFTTANDTERVFDIDIPDSDLEEIVDIISEGMIIQWLKPYLYRQEILESAINTRDFSTYSPAELLLRIGDKCKEAQQNFKNMIREYSYNHGDLTNLHL